MTQELVNRLAGHRNQKPRKTWYQTVDRVVITHLDSAQEAASLERHLIRTLNPVHNSVRYMEVV